MLPLVIKCFPQQVAECRPRLVINLRKYFPTTNMQIYTRATICTLNKFGKIIVNLIRNQINQRDSPTRFSTSCFFHHLNQPETLTNGLKYFSFWFCFRQDIRILIAKKMTRFCKNTKCSPLMVNNQHLFLCHCPFRGLCKNV